MREYGEDWPAEWLRGRGLSDWADYWNKLKRRDSREYVSPPAISNGEAIYANGTAY
jgi:hypothetical protein